MANNVVASLARLMLVTDDRWIAGRDLVEIARAAERGGASSVQVRLKTVAARRQVEMVRALVAAVAIPVLVNDRLDVALAAGAAGVHLGPDDLPPASARRIVPPGFVIGASVGTLSEVAGGEAADYWGVGPWRRTATKPDAGAPLGPAEFGAIVQRAAGRPCLAIGGIEPGDVPAVLAARGTGVAVISGILARDDVETAARSYASAFPLVATISKGEIS